MRKGLVALSLLLFSSLPLLAQEYSKMEVFGGYQYLRVGNANIEGYVTDLNANGWDATLIYNITHFIGVAADFSGAYSTKTISGLGTGHAHEYSYTFGPVFTFNRKGNLQPFLHALEGGGQVGASGCAEGGGGCISVPSQSGFLMAAGGGIDMKFKKSLSIRLVQADWVYTDFSGTTEGKNIRVCAGIVYHFGK